MDGASEFKIFWKIILPLTRPAIATYLMIIFTFIWNDYFWATVLIKVSCNTNYYWIKIIEWSMDYSLSYCGSIVAAIPQLLCLMQKHFIWINA